MTPLIAAGLSLLPKLPEIWSSVASLFGKKAPDSVEEAGKLAGDILGAISKGAVPIERQIQLKTIMYQHEEKIREYTLKERELDYQHEQKKWETYAQIEAQDAASTNKFRAETRPKILRDLFKLTAGYVLFAPLALLAANVAGMAAIAEFAGFLKWIGGFLFSTFGSAYLGYSVVRSAWDKKGENRPDNPLMNAISKLI